MPLAEMIQPAPTPEELCSFADRWVISLDLAAKLHVLAQRLEFGLRMISGFRTVEEQQRLAEEGRPAADPERSTHTSCPATGADVWPTVPATDIVKARLGAEAVLARLRWGGGSPVDPETGIPRDWNHLDLGPRATL